MTRKLTLHYHIQVSIFAIPQNQLDIKQEEVDVTTDSVNGEDVPNPLDFLKVMGSNIYFT